MGGRHHHVDEMREHHRHHHHERRHERHHDERYDPERHSRDFGEENRDREMEERRPNEHGAFRSEAAALKAVGWDIGEDNKGKGKQGGTNPKNSKQPSKVLIQDQASLVGAERFLRRTASAAKKGEELAEGRWEPLEGMWEKLGEESESHAKKWDCKWKECWNK